MGKRRSFPNGRESAKPRCLGRSARTPHQKKPSEGGCTAARDLEVLKRIAERNYELLTTLVPSIGDAWGISTSGYLLTATGRQLEKKNWGKRRQTEAEQSGLREKQGEKAEEGCKV